RTTLLGGAKSTGQLFFKHGDITERSLVGTPRTFSGDIGRRYDLDLVAHVVERQQAVEEHEHTIGNVQIVLGMFPNVFQMTHYVVRKVTHRSCCEGRQLWHSRRPMLTQKLLHCLEYISGAPLALTATNYGDLITPGLHLHVGTRAQKGVAANLLSSFNRLQEKDAGLVGCDGRERRHRRQ